MGPDIQKQRLLDLPTNLDGLEQQAATGLSASNQRIAAIRGGPIPPRTPPRPSTMPSNYNNKRQVPSSRHPPSSTTSLPRSPSPLGSSVSSLHETLKSSDRKSDSRQSVTSNNSSSVSSPPSPIVDRLSSSYDS